MAVSKDVDPPPPKFEPRYADANQLSIWSPPYVADGAVGPGCVVVLCARAVPGSPAISAAAITKCAMRILPVPLLGSRGHPTDGRLCKKLSAVVAEPPASNTQAVTKLRHRDERP
jgi:hypothetical protein